jgi:ferredoxin-NADP reductase
MENASVLHGKSTVKAALVRRRLLSAESQTWHLEFEAEAAFDFVPGQFISVVAERVQPPGHPRAGETKLDTRAYSLASAPRGRFFDLCLNCVESGFFSKMLCESLPVGGTIRFHGPHGNFTLREHSLLQGAAPVLILAEETGIAPVRSILQAISKPQALPALNAHLIQATYAGAALYGEELAAMSPLAYEPVQEDAGHAASLAAARAALAAQPEIREAYVVGLSGFVNAHRTQLKEIGWDRKQIVFERYD